MKHIPRMVVILNLIGFVMSNAATAQTSINSASKQVSLQDISHEYGIGEMVLVNTMQTPSLILTQGYYQPVHSGTAYHDQSIGLDEENWINSISIFPNPTSSALFIQCREATIEGMNYALMDASGKILMQQNNMNLNAGEKASLSMQSFAAGVYYLLLDWKDERAQTRKLSYKINKQN